MTVAKFVQTNYTGQDSATYKSYIDADISVMAGIAADFAPHAQDSPNMTIKIDAGAIQVGTAIVSQAAQNTGTITAPSVNPRKDLVVIDAVTAAISVVTGAENASPVLPAIPLFKIPIAQIALVVGQSSIINSNITDLRMAIGGGASGSSPSAISSVRQTVQGGPVDTAGLPTFFPATATGLNLTTQNITTSFPLVVAAACGFNSGGENNSIGFSAANLTWSSLTNTTTLYLYVTINEGIMTTGFTNLAPIYQWGGTPSTTSGQATYNIQQGIMYLGNGSSAVATALVFVGEATTSGGNVTATVAYAYNGRYDSGYTNTLPGTATAVSKNHNIGTSLVIGVCRLKCLSGEAGFSVGDVVSGISCSSTYFFTFIPAITSKVISICTGTNCAFAVFHKTTGAGTQLTAANWAYELTARREF